MSRQLPFSDLASRHPGVSAGLALAYEEAARVCLTRHHASPVEFRIRDGAKEIEADAHWTRADARLLAAWANEIDATEAGAYAIALATMELTRGLVAVHRAETKTGADYYVGVEGDFEGALRVEISGTSEGTSGVLERRLERKLEQASAGKSSLPATAIVVGFAARTILSADLSFP